MVATAAEALRRWAVGQGTLPLAEGGTQIAPVVRLASLAEDPACALPLAALSSAELAALRERRRAVLGSTAAVLVEQACLAAAIAEFCEFHLPECADPFSTAAPDACQVMNRAARAAACTLARRTHPGFGLALETLFATAATPAELAACRQIDLDLARQCLTLPGRAVCLPAPLIRRLSEQHRAGSPGRPADLLPDLLPGRFAAWLRVLRRTPDGRGSVAWPTIETLRLSALVARLQGGCHPDEALVLGGAASAAEGGLATVPIPYPLPR